MPNSIRTHRMHSM